MNFASLDFLLFFPTVIASYYILPHRHRWKFLLAASVLFYMAFIPAYVLILALTIIVDYIAARLIEQTTDIAKRRLLLLLSIISTLSILFLFKYANFFIENVQGLAQFFHLNYPLELLSIVLPIGLSFHTFQSLSYVIEVYKGNQKAEKHFGIYSLYVMFFPQLVAGPIERPQNLLHQFHRESHPHREDIVEGLELIAWGFFKKTVIADRLAIFVNVVYANPENYSGFFLVMATIAFAFQIYCDFSGYSDIARGSARLLGIQLMRNFDVPYLSSSISEFWKRWHISLSTWFRDYVYIPLGGNRVCLWKQYRNLMSTFVISGFWHGANWTYIAWGALHGSFLIVGILTQHLFNSMLQKEIRIPKSLQILATFILVCIAWIFFRATTIQDAFYILTHVGTFPSEGYFPSWVDFSNRSGMGSLNIAIACSSVLLMMYVEARSRGKEIGDFISKYPPIFRYAVYEIILFSIIFLGSPVGSAFIYFQF